MAENLLTSSMNQSTTQINVSEVDHCLRQLGKGDISFMTDLYRMTSASIYGFALSIVKNQEDAKDILQDCYLSIHRSASQYQSNGKPMAWILTIAKNLAYQRLRERNKTADTEIDTVLLTQSYDNKDQNEMIWLYQCLDQLENEERQIVMLHALSGLKHREIAKILQIPLPTVLSKYHRALKKLKNMMGKES